MENLFIFAGEQSGDLHGSHLIHSLKQKLPRCKLYGVGGNLMKAQGLEVVLSTEKFSVMGFTDVFLSLPRLLRYFYYLKGLILKKQPDGVILIDYPGFNLKMAKSLRKEGYQGKIIHYISPSVWAWDPKRIEIMDRHLDLLLTIFPFENQYYQHTSLQVEYVGNPLKQYIQNYKYKANFREVCHIGKDKELIAIFPGSRKSEILKNFPLQLKAMIKLKQQIANVFFAISIANQEASHIIKQLLEKEPFLTEHYSLIPKEYTYEAMKEAKAAIAKSGTVTLELALHLCPTIVIYSVSAINRFIAKHIIRLKLPFYCIVNILAQETVFPELIEKKPNVDEIVSLTLKAFQDEKTRENCINHCKRIHSLLTNHLASEKATDAIKELFL